MSPTPREVITYLLPHLVVAGAYSAEIQSRVATLDAKGGDTIFHHALSDADLSIQAFLEVVLLARFPELHYFSEEQEQSLNRKYFTGNSSLEVLLDPVDGTRPYIDGKEFYQIIVTLHDDREIVGAVVYMPRREKCFIAVKDEGAFVLSRDDLFLGRVGARLDVSKSVGPVQLFNSPELLATLSKSIEAKDLAVAYLEEPGRYYSTDLLEGKAAGVVHRTCQAIDGGALALIAKEGGAIVTDFEGKEIPSFRSVASRVLPNVIVAANPQVHTSILRALRT